MEGTEVDAWPDHRCLSARRSAVQMEYLGRVRKSRRHSLRQRAEILLALTVRQIHPSALPRPPAHLPDQRQSGAALGDHDSPVGRLA